MLRGRKFRCESPSIPGACYNVWLEITLTVGHNLGHFLDPTLYLLFLEFTCSVDSAHHVSRAVIFTPQLRHESINVRISSSRTSEGSDRITRSRFQPLPREAYFFVKVRLDWASAASNCCISWGRRAMLGHPESACQGSLHSPGASYPD